MRHPIEKADIAFDERLAGSIVDQNGHEILPAGFVLDESGYDLLLDAFPGGLYTGDDWPAGQRDRQRPARQIAAQASRQISTAEQTHHRSRREYAGMKIDQAKRLKELERENTRLKKLLWDAELEKANLREAVATRPQQRSR